MINSIKGFFTKIVSFFKKSDENISVEVEVKKPEIKPIEVKKEEIKEEKEEREEVEKKEEKKFKHSAIVDRDIWE